MGKVLYDLFIVVSEASEAFVSGWDSWHDAAMCIKMLKIGNLGKNTHEILEGWTEEDDYAYCTLPSRFGAKGGWVVNTSGLFHLIDASELRGAEIFRRWFYRMISDAERDAILFEDVRDACEP